MTSPRLRAGVRLTAVAGLSALLLGACTNGQGPVGPTESATAAPSPTVEATAAAEPSPTPSAPFAVPDEITADYVERVLNEIARVDAAATATLRNLPVDEDAVELPEEVDRKLQDVYAEPILTINRRTATALLRSDDERNDLLPPEEYDQLFYGVEEVLLTEPCVAARVDRDFTGTDADIDPRRSTLAFAFLVRAEGANPAGWKLASLLLGSGDGDADDELRRVTAEQLIEEAPEACT